MPNPFRIFIAKVPQSVTNEELTAHFSKFGSIVDVYIPHNPKTQQPKGMAFISFDNADSVDAAINHGEHMLGGQPLEAKRADPKPEQRGRGAEPPQYGMSRYDFGHDDPYGYGPPRGMMPYPGGPGMGDFGGGGGGGRAPRFRVFVREIPDSISEEALRQYFEKFGVVSDVYIPVTQGPDGPRRRGIAYITFKAEAQLERCLATQRHELQGVELPCSRADDRIERKRDERGGSRMRGPDYPPYGGPDFGMRFGDMPPPRGRPERQAPRGEILVSPKRIFVGGIPHDMSSRQVSDHFKQHGGEITDVYFPKDSKSGSHRGFCYITFAEEIAVHRAVANAPREIGGVPIGEVKVAEARPNGGGGGGGRDMGPPPMHGGYDMDDMGMYGGRGGGSSMGYGGAPEMRMGMGGGSGYDRGPGYDRNVGYDRGPSYDRGGYGGGGGGYGERDSYGAPTSFLNRFGTLDGDVQPHYNESVRAGIDDLVQALSGKINPLLQQVLSASPGAGVGGPPQQSGYGSGYGGGVGGYGGGPASGGYGGPASGYGGPAPGYGGGPVRSHDGYGGAADSRYRPY